MSRQTVLGGRQHVDTKDVCSKQQSSVSDDPVNDKDLKAKRHFERYVAGIRVFSFVTGANIAPTPVLIRPFRLLGFMAQLNETTKNLSRPGLSPKQIAYTRRDVHQSSTLDRQDLSGGLTYESIR